MADESRNDSRCKSGIVKEKEPKNTGQGALSISDTFARALGATSHDLANIPMYKETDPSVPRRECISIVRANRT